MTWAPISLLTPQYQNPTDNTPYSGAVLKAYATGTTTNISMATDSTGGTTFTSVALNSSGIPEHSGSIIIPFIDQAYKIALYPDQATADADTTASAIFVIDGLTPVAVSGNFTVNDTETSAVTDVITMIHTVTGTPLVGIGAGLAYSVETADGNNEVGMTLDAVTTNVGSGTEAFDLVLNLMQAGAAAAEKFRVDSAGDMSNQGTTQASSSTTGAIKTPGGISSQKQIYAAGDIISDSSLRPLGDTAAGDLAALGYNSTDGAVLTGQGSTSDVTLKNDAGVVVFSIPTGTTNGDVVGDFTAQTLNADGSVSAGDSSTIGYSAANGLELIGQGSTNDWNFLNDTGASVIRLPTGTLGPVFAGTADFSAAGIVFDDETLDTYDEGTFTPVLSDGTNDATTATAYGNYTRIGNMVWINMRISTSSLGSVSGGLRVTGLPFTPVGGSVDSQISCGEATGLAITAGHSLTGYVEVGAWMIIGVWDSTAGTTQLDATEWSANGNAYFSGVYEV